MSHLQRQIFKLRVKYQLQHETRHIYKKVESEGVVNVYTIKQEIEKDKLSRAI